MHIFGNSKRSPAPFSSPSAASGRAGAAGAAEAGASSIPSITERDFEHEVLLSEIPALVVFIRAGSAQCQAIERDLNAFATDVSGKVKVLQVDVDRAPTLARQLRLQQVPTFLLFANQRLADAQAGPLTKKQLLAMVEPVMPRQQGAIKAKELAVLLKQGVVAAVDIRDANAFGRAHLPRATSLPADELESRLAELFMLPGQPVLYDRSGQQAVELANKLAETGTQVAFLEGGILAWEAEALPIERG